MLIENTRIELRKKKLAKGKEKHNLRFQNNSHV